MNIPFGKYKDQSLATMLADQQYVDWCQQNNVFDRYPEIKKAVKKHSTTNNGRDSASGSGGFFASMVKDVVGSVAVVDSALKIPKLKEEKEKLEKQIKKEKQIHQDLLQENSTIIALKSELQNQTNIIAQCINRLTTFNHEQSDKLSGYYEQLQANMAVIFNELEQKTNDIDIVAERIKVLKTKKQKINEQLKTARKTVA